MRSPRPPLRRLLPIIYNPPRAVASPAFSSPNHHHLPCILPQLSLSPSLPVLEPRVPRASGVRVGRRVPSSEEGVEGKTMAKGGLGKLRCMIRRWHSSSRIARAPSPPGEDGVDARGASFHGADEVPKGLHPVYVGKSRRRYLIAEELVGHPLFQTLVDRTGGGGAAEAGCTVVGCEVVLFEHMLWMLENADPPPESLDELVEYYAC
ncbi:hypothetical protein SETIT_6G170000v2 [Setaria italica]|uniref:Uncharacterized protein n=1 Tax=Setaria italica TaxID=4555 RepID=A0A368RMG5_SETIT|nr:hypothetical protein SETIT_6G170000v2 [Setaria italica]